MEGLVRGDIVVINFPFSDLTSTKRRPVLILAGAGRGDYILCQITSKAMSDSYAVMLDTGDFEEGGLSLTSYIRPTKLFTADESLFVYKACKISKQKLTEAVNVLIQALSE